MKEKSKKVAVVTGSNRGIGFEVALELAQKEYEVILTARDAEKGKEALKKLNEKNIEAKFHPLDVTNSKSILALRDHIEKNFGRLDVLVNNAGVFLDSKRTGTIESTSAFDVSIDTVRETMETNVYGPFQLCQSLIPLMLKNGYGRVVNLSSGMGQLSEMSGGWPAYRMSKTAINAITRVFADETRGKGILVNSVCPGWVKTDMGGSGAELTVQEGADTVVWLATLPESGPTGGFFREREKIDW